MVWVDLMTFKSEVDAGAFRALVDFVSVLCSNRIAAELTGLRHTPGTLGCMAGLGRTVLIVCLGRPAFNAQFLSTITRWPYAEVARVFLRCANAERRCDRSGWTSFTTFAVLRPS